MTGRIRRTTLTASCLFGAYWLYAFGTSQILTPPVAAGPVTSSQSPTGAEKPPLRNVQMAKRHLDHQLWASDAKYQFSTSEQAFLFADEWNRVEPSGAVRFKPFAMIWFEHPENPDEVPITLFADSALIEFSKPFSTTNPDPGRVIGGALEGKVDIRGPNGLTILGKNFVYSETAMRIWSDNNAAFTFDGHQGSGHGVQLDLIADENAGEGTSLAATGVRSVRLRRNVEFQLRVNEDDQPSVVTVTSDGAFQFQIEEHIATFENNVHVRRPTNKGQFDMLDCDLMTIVLTEGDRGSDENDLTELAANNDVAEAESKAESDSRNSDSQSAKPASFGSVGRGLRFQRLRAQGERVLLKSEENDLVADMAEFVYDVESKVAVLLDGNGVRVHQGKSDLQAPEITLLHGERGKVVSAWCRGAGQLEHRDDKTGELMLVARWLKQLKKYDDPDSEAEVIELQGEAVIRQPQEGGGLAGELIKLWYESESQSPMNGLVAATDGREKIVPKRLLAVDKVALVSPKLEGETDRLEVWFEQDEISKSSQPRESRRVSINENGGGQAFASTNDDGAHPFFGSDRNVSARPAGSVPQKTSNAISDLPVRVSARLIRVRARSDDPSSKQMQVAEVWTEGQVVVTQQRESDQLPLRLTGDRLHLRNHSEADQDVRIFGSPATVRDTSAYIEGDEIFLDRDENISRIQGKGLLRLPVRSDLEGNELQQAADLDIWWSEKMIFNGIQAEFYGDVRAVLDDNRMNCEEMHVELTERVSFNGESSNNKKTEICNIFCKQGVQFDSYEYENNKLTGVRKARFWEFATNQLTGETEASGPGHILFWRKGRGNRAGLGPTGMVQANRPVQSDASDWEYVRIDFTGKTTGNLRHKHSTFHDRVQIVYGPVERPLDLIDPDELPDNAGWMRCQELQFNQVPGVGDDTPATQLLARGNAELEGRTFHARADTISFDESKGLYMLRSLGERKATIWRQKRVGEEYSRADAQRMEFIPSRNQLKLDQTTGVQGLQ